MVQEPAATGDVDSQRIALRVEQGKCQSTAAKRWLDARQADLLPVECYHVVDTLLAPIALANRFELAASARSERVKAGLP